MKLFDVTVTANWIPDNDVVAIMNKKYYKSISSALSDANDQDEIQLLKNTSEDITIDKNIILDFANNKLSGHIENNSKLTIINGIIENPNGTAITNNGILVLGENDNIISNDSVKIIGNQIGIKQNGTLNFYDGTIEGIVPLGHFSKH